MHPTGIAAALRGLFTLNAVELLEDLDGNRQIILLKFVDRLRVVQQNVRVEHKGLHLLGYVP